MKEQLANPLYSGLSLSDDSPLFSDDIRRQSFLCEHSLSGQIFTAREFADDHRRQCFQKRYPVPMPPSRIRKLKMPASPVCEVLRAHHIGDNRTDNRYHDFWLESLEYLAETNFPSSASFAALFGV